MSCAEVRLPGRIVLIDPSSFTISYDKALLQALANEGVHVRLLGPAGETCDNPLRHGHFYPVLASPLGRSLPRAGQRLVKGMSHPIDMLRLANWLAAFGTEIVHFQWAPVPLIDRWIIALLRRRLPVVLTLHDSNPYQGYASWLMRRGYANLLEDLRSIIVHTEQARGRVIAMGVDPGTVHRIPHGLLGTREKYLRAFEAPRPPVAARTATIRQDQTLQRRRYSARRPCAPARPRYGANLNAPIVGQNLHGDRPHRQVNIG